MAKAKATKTPTVSTKKTKSQPKEKAAKKKASKSSIPAIQRPRSMTVESFAQYILTLRGSYEYRVAELERMHAEKKCPHKAIQHVKSFLKEIEYIEKRMGPMIRPRRKQTDKKNNILMKKVNVSPQLAAFLKLKKGEQVSRSECNTAITMYINVKDRDNVPAEKRKWLERMNPDNVGRCLQTDTKSIIEPDEALSKLLNYPAYQKRVKAGKQVWHRKNKETGEKVDKVETEDHLTYSVVQHLLAPHFRTAAAATTEEAAPAAAKKGGRKAKAPEPESEVEESEVDDDEEDEE
jgi:chromatin remodeling complex protein RSC6